MKPVPWFVGLLCALLALAGCRGVPTQGERQSRRDLKQVADAYRPDNRKPELPALTPDSTLSNFLAYAILNSPKVEAAFYDWSATVERITVDRSLPDPQLLFQAYIQNVITSLMPGLQQQFPGPGKLKARANVTTAESQGKYFAFETAVLESALDLKRAYYELCFLSERLEIDRETLALLNDLERIARAQNAVGKGTLQDVLRAQIERDRVSTEIADLEDTRLPRLASFKGALGMTRQQPDPPVPVHVELATVYPDLDTLLDIAFERNPRLEAMESDVRAAEAAIAVAYKERVPDFNLALMADVKASPVLYWPQASMSLPIWRDKLAAEVSQAKAGQLAAQARLSAEQISLTVEFAEKSFAWREINRNLALLQKQLIPKGRQSLEIARAGYLSGSIDFFNLMDAQRTLLGFRMNEVEERTLREITLAELSLWIAGVPPAGSPVLAAPSQNKTTP